MITCILKNASEVVPSIRVQMSGRWIGYFGQWSARCPVPCCVLLMAGRECSAQA